MPQGESAESIRPISTVQDLPRPQQGCVPEELEVLLPCRSAVPLRGPHASDYKGFSVLLRRTEESEAILPAAIHAAECPNRAWPGRSRPVLGQGSQMAVMCVTAFT